ncbi:L-serine ammonia-lyase, iron-sulfur-dependent, subunit alpha [Treponema phagedenis]|uniref:L-serine dehydratase n=1 Tax=Treponema phagedenis TaxID=162 RepID=A0A0B7GSP1_TREPH|nr:L-serine ammonia-lyase, iron-sulfur-dependent, subunit alpha [Treponema phagedenis]NVP23021.1 L-serine ammonia-lyase, iron-sulfur-dependent, subunit alpha [Treponema phagedenis]QEJ95142.1 L-serine ammonia-lyase, iron-sulfur-dependent, subunit alpha [Treponema phagedenis]QEJ98187.1 L-serine ammonia-lyase, iron-sulfur-dependent, subunit alpha [Treponema phagedenis]QEK01066.1 L-serine ammonia-lyase, iron-sulfur-dependent, subunit alpha [Treponema phagedenis]QEK03694.1 L-serine ammonia-lyase, i
MISYETISELVEIAIQKNEKISEIVLQDQIVQMEKPRDELLKRMEENLDVMLDSIEKGSQKGVKSKSGLTGGDAYLLKQKIEADSFLTGPLMANAIQMAIAVSEINAAMGKIVASPTAGSCGILPAALGSMIKIQKTAKADAVLSLFTAGAIGMVIANKASIAGASGGCQAECGSASAMAAACIVELSGGTAQMVQESVAIALKCILGLVCDPVAGLVEIPCIKRNASGVTLAFTAAEMALAGIKSIIPVDEVILTMKRIGDSMPSSLKETAEGGLAVTQTGIELQKKVFGSADVNIGFSCASCGACG